MLMANMQDDISDVELKQRWRLYWLQCIFEFSSTRLQEMSWVQGSEASWPEGEEWPSSYHECISAYFDTLALDDAYEKALEWGNVSEQEAEKAKTFHILAAFYMEPGEDPLEIINDPEWLEVVEAAKELWDYLKGSVASPREIELMNKLERDFS